MSLRDKDHPIWRILQVVVLGGVLWYNAKNFDSTEIMAIIEWSVIWFGVERLRER